ncbi:MFS transporter [Sphingomonas sp. MMS24-J13]|uniref:MFS transporter n=1 Tax=Sphingomonas sp. MMS24-J13 TaxID=3238686 RepID=UPI003850BFFB
MTVAAPNWLSATLDGAGDWRLRARIPWLFGLIMLFNSWDSVSIAFILPSIAQQWGLGPLQSGWLVSAGYGGQFLGAIVCGWLAERHGRLPVLRAVVILMCLLAIACAAAPDVHALIAIRLVQGLAIGGATPVAISYINEVAPAATRGRFFGTFQFLMLSGFGLASLLSAFIVPAFGWRAVFALGTAPLGLAPFLFAVPESPRWLAMRGRSREAIAALARLGGNPPATAPAGFPPSERPALAALFSRELRGLTLVAGSMWFLTSLVSFGLVSWVPSLYVSVFGMPIARALRYNAIASLFVFVLPLLLRVTIDRTGRRLPPLIGTGLGGLALLTLILVSRWGEAWLVAFTIIGQIGVSIGSMVLWPYTAESYPTPIRAVALGAASSLARGASMLTPLVVGGMLALTGSVVPVFLIFGTSAVVTALLWAFATRETAGREIDA